MNNTGQRIKSVILKGKSFWNWKNENDISVNIPEPNDYRVKISYDTNVELVFNREVIFSATYPKKQDVPKLRDIIPTGYKLLYPNSEISIYNNNRFVVVYDYYEVNVHYREESDINKDISVFTGRFQYGALITKDIINWPNGRSSKQKWIDFPVGELTPARVIDKYVYLSSSGGNTLEWGPTPSEFQNETTINFIDNNKPWLDSHITIPAGYYDQDSRNMGNLYNDMINYRHPMLINNINWNTMHDTYNIINIGQVNNWQLINPNIYYFRMHYRPQDFNENGGVTDWLGRRVYPYLVTIYYDAYNGEFDFLNIENIDETKLRTFLEDIVPKIKSAYPSTYNIDIDPNEKILYQKNKLLIDSLWPVVTTDKGTPIITTLTNMAGLSSADSMEYLSNISDRLTNLETKTNPYQGYYKTKIFTPTEEVYAQTDRQHSNPPVERLLGGSITNTYKVIDNIHIGSNIHGLAYVLIPLKPLMQLGIYLNKDNKMYKYYMYTNYMAEINKNIMNVFPSIASDGVNVRTDNKVIRFRFMRDATNKNTYNEYKLGDGTDLPNTGFGSYNDIIINTNNPYLHGDCDYFHIHNGSDTKAILIDNNQAYFDDNKLEELSLLLETRKVAGSGDDPAYKKQKYRIHFFDENGNEMKEYLTDQYIKDGEPPSPYPPRKYELDPNKPWTRNPNDPHEIYVYLIKRKCKIMVKFRVSNPLNLKHKYWVPLCNNNIDIYEEIVLIDSHIDLNKYIDMINTRYGKYMGFITLKNININTKFQTEVNTIVIDDNSAIIFNYDLTKSGSILATIKLSDARKEFGIINKYFDYSLAAVILDKNMLFDRATFENEHKERTKKLISYKSDISTIHRSPITGALYNNIIYLKSLYTAFPNAMIIESLKIYTVKNNVRTLKAEVHDLDIKDILADKALSYTFGQTSVEIDNKYPNSSNIARFLVDNPNNIHEKDIFRILFANSPDFIEEGIDVEVDIEWSEDMLNFIYKNSYAVDIRLIPSALLPDIDHNAFNMDNFNIIGMNEEWAMIGAIAGTDPARYNLYKANIFDEDTVINQNKANKNGFDYTKVEPDYLEAIKVTHIDMFLGTSGFRLRPWSIRQILSRPIPVIKASHNLVPSAPENTGGLLVHSFFFTQTNYDKSDKLNNKTIYNCFNHTFSDNTEEVSDENVTIVKLAGYNRDPRIADSIYNINTPDLHDVFMFPGNAKYTANNFTNTVYGTLDINDWFKIAINRYKMQSSGAKMNQLIDMFRDKMRSPSLYRDVSEVITDPKPYKPIEFSYVKRDIEHGYIDTNLFKNEKWQRYIFNTRMIDDNSDVNLSGNANIIRNFDENGLTVACYKGYSNDVDIIKCKIKTAYKGYLQHKPKFVQYIADEIMYSSHDIKNKTEFRIISGDMYNSKSDAISYNVHENILNGNVYNLYKNFKGYKDLIDKGEIVQYPADKLVFDEDSVIKLIYSGENYHEISDVRHLKWHLIDRKNFTVVLDFERKYMLDFSTPYSRSIIIPNLAELADYSMNIINTGFEHTVNNETVLINDPSTWMEPLMSYYGLALRDNYNTYVGVSDKRYTNRVCLLDNLTYMTPLNINTNIDIGLSASKVYYALLMHDVYNSKKDDGYSVRQEIYNDKDFIKYKYHRYPDNNEIDKFVNIHMFNNTIVTADNEVLYDLKPSRYDYRFHPFSIHCKFLGYNMYDMLFKATSMFDLHSNDLPNKLYGRDEYANMNYNAIYRYRYNPGNEQSRNERFEYNISKYTQTDMYDYLLEPTKHNNRNLNPGTSCINVITPNIYHNFGMPEINRQLRYLQNGSFYRPVLMDNENIMGLSYRSPGFKNVETETFMENPTGTYPYALWNPYAIIEKTDKTLSGAQFEDIFRTVWDPYTGYRLSGKSTLLGNQYLYLSNLFYHYTDPYNITTNWMLRVSKNIIHFGGAWSDNVMTNNPAAIRQGLNLVEQGIPGDPISCGAKRYENGMKTENDRIINQFEGRGQTCCFHPLELKYICHPFQRTCLLLIRLVADSNVVGEYNTNSNTYLLPVYLGYFNIRYEEIESRKNDANALKEYIKECVMRSNSGYEYYLKNFCYSYIYNSSTQKIHSFEVDTGNPLDVRVVYEEHHDSTPGYQFYVDMALKAHITGEDVRKPDNAHICDNKALHHDGGNAIIFYFIDMKYAGTIRNKLGNNNLSKEEFYDAINYLSTHSLERIPASDKWNIPEYFVHKYSMFNGVKRFGWSAYNGQYLPKWPAVIPDNLTLLVSQNAFNINNSVNKIIHYGTRNNLLIISNTNIMMHPSFIGGIPNRKPVYENFDSTKFYGSINVAQIEYNNFRDIKPGEREYKQFEYYTNRTWDCTNVSNEDWRPTVTELSGIYNFNFYIRYSIDTIGNVQSKWIKQRAYALMHDIFMHRSTYNKSKITSTYTGIDTAQAFLRTCKEAVRQPTLSANGVSNYNLWDDESSIGFRMDLNPNSLDILYTSARYAPTAIQWNLAAVYRRDNQTDFFQQKQFWKGVKNYKIHEIEYNPDARPTYYQNYRAYLS